MAVTIKDMRRLPNADRFSDEQLHDFARQAGFDLDPVEQNTGFGGDTVTDIERGVLQLPGAVVGLGDAVLGLTGANRPLDKATDWIGDKTGFQPGKTAELMQYDYSPQRKASDAAIEQAWADPNTSGLDVAGAYLANPRSTLGSVVQSLPAMLAGGLAGRYGLGLQKAAQAVKAGAMTQAEYMALAAKAAGAGEGAVMAGQAMQNIDESVDPQKAGLAALGIGFSGGAIGYGSGRIANALGLGDIEQAAATGGTAGLGSSALSPAKRIVGGAIQEGPIEEGLQSVAETGLQNMAEDKPFNEGMARNVVEGSIAGALMGGGINAFSRDNPQANVNPNAGPLEKAANTVAPAQPQTLALPELIFTADGQSIDKAELMRNFIANGVPSRDAVEYIRRIGAMPQEERTAVNLDPYRFLQERDAKTLQEGEALAERAAIQNEYAGQDAEADNTIPTESNPSERKPDDPTRDEVAAYDEYYAQKEQDKQIKQRSINDSQNQDNTKTQATQPKTEQAGGVQPAESGVSAQAGGAGQAPSFVATHTLSDGTPVRFNDDEQGFEDAQGNITDPDGYEIKLKEPINANSPARNATENNQRAASQNQGAGANQRGLGEGLADNGRRDIDGGTGGNIGGIPGAVNTDNGIDIGTLTNKPKTAAVGKVFGGFTPEESADIINSGAKNLTNYARTRYGTDRVKGRDLNKELERLNGKSQNTTTQETSAEKAVVPHEGLDKNDPLFEKKNLLRRLKNTVNNGTDPQGKPLMGTDLEKSYNNSIAKLEAEIEQQTNQTQAAQPDAGADTGRNETPVGSGKVESEVLGSKERVNPSYEQTSVDFLTAAEKELGADFKGLKGSFIDEHYKSIEDHVKNGGKITKQVFDSLEPGKQYHFNKTYGQKGIKDDGVRQSEIDRLNNISDAKLAKAAKEKAEEEKADRDKSLAQKIRVAQEKVDRARKDVELGKPKSIRLSESEKTAIVERNKQTLEEADSELKKLQEANTQATTGAESGEEIKAQPTDDRASVDINTNYPNDKYKTNNSQELSRIREKREALENFLKCARG